VLVGLLAVTQPVAAQSETGLTLRLNRDWGYGGFGQIQGLFSMSVSGAEDLKRVVFLIDGEPIGEDTEAPFKFQFTTDDYEPGTRVMSAVGYTGDGQGLSTNEITAEFISADAAGKGMSKIMGPVGGLLLGLIVVMVAATLLSARKRSHVPLGQPRQYGISGGTICPKCNRPFALSFLGFNIGMGKLMPCPHCGRWSVVRRWPIDALRAAEQAELASADGQPQVADISEEERERKELDDSRYRDG